VRFCALEALGQLCIDLAPDLQQEHHATLLPPLIAALDGQHATAVAGLALPPRAAAKLRTRAANALINFVEQCDADELAPYVIAPFL
jgi:hypothetical protein